MGDVLEEVEQCGAEEYRWQIKPGEGLLPYKKRHDADGRAFGVVETYFERMCLVVSVVLALVAQTKLVGTLETETRVHELHQAVQVEQDYE